MAQKEHLVEVLSFRRGDNLATIATDGVRHVTQEFELIREHGRLASAIAYLEGKGYEILIDEFESV